MNIINLTPHSINIHNEDERLIMTVEPSGKIARIGTTTVKTGHVGNVPLFETKVTGEPVVVGDTPFPEEQLDTIYIVSGLFRSHFSRPDIYQPGRLLRDGDGKPVGCIGLSQ